jgi:hypothetical protein
MSNAQQQTCRGERSAIAWLLRFEPALFGDKCSPARTANSAASGDHLNQKLATAGGSLDRLVTSSLLQPEPLPVAWSIPRIRKAVACRPNLLLAGT